MAQIAIFNRQSGAFEDEPDVSALAQSLCEPLGDCQIEITTGDELATTLEKAAEDYRTVWVAGGDGTIAAAGAALAGTDAELGVLPFGTMNLFARDLAIPLDPKEAARALAKGQTRKIDVAYANEHAFLINAVAGVFTELAEEREEARHHRADAFDVFSAMVREMIEFKALWYRVDLPGHRPKFMQTSTLFVSNNRIEDAENLIIHRQSPDAGELALYWAREGSAIGFLRSIVRFSLGGWREDPWLVEQVLSECELRLRDADDPIEMSLDGEVRHIPQPVRFRIDPGALEVRVPA